MHNLWLWLQLSVRKWSPIQTISISAMDSETVCWSELPAVAARAIPALTKYCIEKGWKLGWGSQLQSAPCKFEVSDCLATLATMSTWRASNNPIIVNMHITSTEMQPPCPGVLNSSHSGNPPKPCCVQLPCWMATLKLLHWSVLLSITIPCECSSVGRFTH